MELRDYLAVMRARWLTIALATVLVGGLAFAWTLTQPKVYTAHSSVLVTPGTAWAGQDGLLAENYARTRMGSYSVVAKSDQVAVYAAEQEGVSGDPYDLLDRVTVINPDDTTLLNFSASGPSPEAARRLVEVWVEGTTLAINEIERTARDDNAGVTVTTLEAPRLPAVPSAPRTKQAVAIGLMLGLVLGIAYAFVRASLDRRVRTREDVERAAATSVVGALPWDGALSKKGAGHRAPDFRLVEAVRQLRTNLQFMDVDHPPRVIVVTSPLPGDGKSTTSILLAEAIAESGKPVVLVDADLRRPSLAAELGLVGAGGLTSVLAGQAALEDVLQKAGPTGLLSVLASGPIPPNPSELVGSEAMRKLLYSFPEDTIILVDTPPLVPVTDASVLAARTDGALVVVRSGSTTFDTMDEAMAILARVRGRALGVVLNGAHGVGARMRAYAYTSSQVPAPLAVSEAQADEGGEDADSQSGEPPSEAADDAPERPAPTDAVSVASLAAADAGEDFDAVEAAADAAADVDPGSGGAASEGEQRAPAKGDDRAHATRGSA